MDTFIHTLTSVESAVINDAVATKNYVAKTAPVALKNLENWIIDNPKKACAIFFFVVGFILGTLV
jgi:ElaB/YqjD/DUF883 family membrane-anchored ribosome-binding protein